MAKAVKLADIAAKLDISVVTVSKALSGQKGVSEKLREEIVALADEMGYVQPSTARKLAQRRSHNIGVLIREKYMDQYASFYWQMYQQATRIAGERGSFTLLEEISPRMEKETILPRLILEAKVDGLLLIGDLEDTYRTVLAAQGIPIMYLDYADRGMDCDAVISDSYYGAARMTDYLISMGHREIGFVGTVLSTPSITDRYLGYVKALMENGLSANPDWVIEDRNPAGDRIDAENYLKLPDRLPTAFLCNCDVAAGMLIRKLENAGIRVPEDVSVAGFDNFAYPGLCDVEITTIDVNLTEMSGRAVNRLLDRLDDQPYSRGIHIIEGALIEKKSVKKISKKG
ncbi:MAG: substrate-binding domain-containing protein [Lachnospiraceae bacterium]|nr:substrate-binding domain-containing protein [Lachnospiraceae bacterium]